MDLTIDFLNVCIKTLDKKVAVDHNNSTSPIITIGSLLEKNRLMQRKPTGFLTASGELVRYPLVFALDDVILKRIILHSIIPWSYSSLY